MMTKKSTQVVSTQTTMRAQRWELPIDASPSTTLPLDRRLTGVYTLEFTDGERYVGQTVDLIHRLGTHRRRWPREIIAVQFIECAPEQLDALERRMITETEQSFTIRNRALTRMPGGSVPLDLLIDSTLQHDWLRGALDGPYPEDARSKAAERRIRTRAQYEKMAALPDYPVLLDAIGCYIMKVIPWPSVTGGLFWGVTAMPGTSKSRDWFRYATVSSHNVETFYAAHDRETDEDIVVLNMDPGHVTRAERRELGIDTHSHYRSYAPVDRLVTPLDDVPALLDDYPNVLAGARTMALGLMRRGPSVFVKFHSDAFLDDVLVHAAEGSRTEKR